MRLARKLALGLAILSTPAFACLCIGVRGDTPWDRAEQEAQVSPVIFEGTLERAEMVWNVLTAKPGEFVPIEFGSRNQDTLTDPFMRITMHVKRVYKGNLGPTVQLVTKLGGGDCGAKYTTGLDYLVYAGGPGYRDLEVGLCSPGGWLESADIATELRHLRKERPLATDLERKRSQSLNDNSSYEAATGRICGVARVDAATPKSGAALYFLSTAGYSPSWDGMGVHVDSNGRFCSARLGPGEYAVLLRGLTEDGLATSSYYPGVPNREEAQTVRVTAGQTSTLDFRVPKLKTHNVRGFLSIDLKSNLERISVVLTGMDGRIFHAESINAGGAFPLPNVKYFAIENVPPGRYLAYAQPHDSPQKGLTKVVHVNVTTQSELVFLELKLTSKPAGN